MRNVIKTITFICLSIGTICMTHSNKVYASNYTVETGDIKIEILANGDAIINERWVVGYGGESREFSKSLP